MNRNILITGGAGFIGSHACKHFIAGGDVVVNLDKLTYAANLDTLRSIDGHHRYNFVHGDIADTALVGALLRDKQIDAVLNLAAESHVDRSISAPSEFIQTNIVGTFNLLRAVMDYFDDLRGVARHNFRFIHVSTDEVYGSLAEDGRFTEETPAKPRSPYAASKAASDHLVSACFHTYGLPAIISNCSNNYGPYQFPEKLIPLVILNAIEHKPLPVYGDGINVRDWLYVGDHVRALELLLSSGVAGQCYNIGGRTERRNIDVVHDICRLLTTKNAVCPPGGFERLITFVNDRPGHDLRYAVDCSKIERELGWRPSLDFETGLSQTIDWYVTNEEWWGPIRKHVYLGDRLGEARQRLLV